MKNLFDYIRYQNVNLSSPRELEELPEELIFIYKDRASLFGTGGIKKHDCKMLAFKYLLSGECEKEHMKSLYEKSLKKYCSKE